MGVKRLLTIIGAVVLLMLLIITIIIPIATGTKSVTVTLTEDSVGLLIESEGSTKVLWDCKAFHTAYFMRDYDYDGKFRMYFPDGDDDELYLKSKLFCGALISIDDTTGRNLNETIRNINKDYAMYSINLDYDYIDTFIEENERVEWLSYVGGYLASEISKGV